MILSKKGFLAILAVTGIILLIPLIAMNFTTTVQWNFADFLIAGLLLIGTGILIELIRNVTMNKAFRVIVIGLLIAILFLVWAELAVGIFGTPFAGD